MLLEGATGNIYKNSHALNALTYQAETVHAISTSAVSAFRFLWLLNDNP